MLTYIIASLFCLRSLFLHDPAELHNLQLVKIQGSCLNAVTKARLKSSAFALYKQSKVKVGESDATGRFNLVVPVLTETIVFESEGFRQAVIPVKFNQGISDNARFRLTVEMGAPNWQAVAIVNQLCLNFDVPADLEINYKVVPIDGKESGISLTMKPEWNQKQPLTNLNIDTVKPGKTYLVTATSAGGELLFTNTVKINPGSNFLAVIVKKPDPVQVVTSSAAVATVVVAAPVPKERPAKFFSPTTVYFDQSSYDLRDAAKMMLDSVSTILIQRPTIRLNVTGYTENIGRRDLNVILSEFRARTVANYLKQKGVRPDQLFLTGRGPDSLATSDDPESNRLRNRRVVIQFLPR
ncbi:OmpA family protein [Fibrella forsythiae]|uniref:OmpA family protein n=1 Tax=Fibrella forsythiae TaxID=2817061 RepID=A0ABS3JEA5_9BACT|nr:OmpA family protein [Fibrella forsythiae]MBO0948336.1 OmpA family protein [Fibrella forsythiae]